VNHASRDREGVGVTHKITAEQSILSRKQKYHESFLEGFGVGLKTLMGMAMPPTCQEGKSTM